MSVFRKMNLPDNDYKILKLMFYPALVPSRDFKIKLNEKYWKFRTRLSDCEGFVKVTKGVFF